MRVVKVLVVLLASVSLAVFGLGCGDDDDEGGGGGGGSVSEAEFVAACVPFMEECSEEDEEMSADAYCQASYGIHGEVGGAACQSAAVDFYTCIRAAGCEQGEACSAEVAAHTEACGGLEG